MSTFLSRIDTETLFSLFARVLVLLTCIPLHECAHGWMAAKLGDTTARDQGRLTLNPLRHLDLVGTISLVFLGIGWAKPVPVNPSNFRGDRKRGMALTALAGPLSNALLALMLLVLYKLAFVGLGASGLFAYDVSVLLMRVLSIMITTNVSLAVFNLLPINPLDGSRILGLILPDPVYYKLMQFERYIYGVLLLALVLGFLDTPIYWLSQKLLGGLDFLTSFIDVIARAVL